MAENKLVALLREGATKWNTWKQHSPLRMADLRGADLAGLDLRGANLKDVDLGFSRLQNTNLREANLQYALLSEADLTDADLGNAVLVGATLYGTKLDGANLRDAIFGATIFAAVDLSTVRDADSSRHHRPSSIGIDTLLSSGGKIPRDFLRGCGVDPLLQDVLVGDAMARTEAFTYFLSKRHQPFQRCFISYATEDKQFADRLQSALNQYGVDYWYAPEHGKWGEELHSQIERQISLRDRMLLICSEKSLTKDWVIYEIERAIAAEKTRGNRVIFPIMIDSALLDWDHPRATRIRDVLAADFRKATRGAAFDNAISRLLQSLRACGVATPA